MIALNDGHVAVADAPRTRRVTRKTADQSPKNPPARVAKSKDASKSKVSFYLDAQTAEKLAVAAIIRGSDQSDVANAILAAALSSVTFYDRSTTRTPGEPLTVEKIGDPAGSE